MRKDKIEEVELHYARLPCAREGQAAEAAAKLFSFGKRGCLVVRLSRFSRRPFSARVAWPLLFGLVVRS